MKRDGELLGFLIGSSYLMVDEYSGVGMSGLVLCDQFLGEKGRLLRGGSLCWRRTMLKVVFWWFEVM